MSAEYLWVKAKKGNSQDSAKHLRNYLDSGKFLRVRVSSSVIVILQFFKLLLKT